MLPTAVSHLSLASAPGTVEEALRRARRAQAEWAASAITERLAIVRRFRQSLALDAERLARTVGSAGRNSMAETLSAELLPLAAACRFLEKQAPRLLRPRRLSSRGVGFGWPPRVEVERSPWGLVLVISPANYPIFLAGVQTVQALTAGNGVLLKPAPGGEIAAEALTQLLLQAGLPADLVTVLDAAPEMARQIMGRGVDKVLFTGSSTTGRKIQQQLVGNLTPATLELSGCDAVFVLPGADLKAVADALRFGVCLNSGETCIAPRRVFVCGQQAEELEAELRRRLSGVALGSLSDASARSLQRVVVDALRDGARLVVGSLQFDRVARPVVLGDVRAEMEAMDIDLFAPLLSIVRVDSMEEALEIDRRCRYGLGASVFGPSAAAAALAAHVPAGVVVVNDMIAPTADPRVPFGGRGESGFGVTRGAEGLTDLTRPKVKVISRGRWRPHYLPLQDGDELLFLGALKGRYGASWRQRLAGWKQVFVALRRRARGTPEAPTRKKVR